MLDFSSAVQHSSPLVSPVFAVSSWTCNSNSSHNSACLNLTVLFCLPPLNLIFAFVLTCTCVGVFLYWYEWYLCHFMATRGVICFHHTASFWVHSQLCTWPLRPPVKPPEDFELNPHDFDIDAELIPTDLNQSSTGFVLKPKLDIHGQGKSQQSTQKVE